MKFMESRYSYLYRPGKVSHEKYYDDLLKQNSMIYENWKVYKWTDGQLKRFTDKVKDEIYTFLSDVIEDGKEDYLLKPQDNVLELRDYQEEALNSFKNLRK